MLERILSGTAIFAMLISAAIAGPVEDGVDAYARGDFAAALEIWKPLAEEGNAVAQTNIASMYANGEGVSLDNGEAAKWYRRAAEQGNAMAQYNLGYLYRSGESVPQDNNEAVKWYRLAAEQGNALAQSDLGIMYFRGDGVEKDFIFAHLWLNLAAAQGETQMADFVDIITRQMTADQINDAWQLARDWKLKQEP